MMVVYNQIGGLEFQSFRVYREEQRIILFGSVEK